MTNKLDDVFVHPGHLIRRAHQIHMSLFEDEFAVYDISPVQYVILRTVEALDEVDLSTAAGIAAVDKPSCTRFVSRLVERGLVSMSSDKADQRRKLLRLTSKGRNLLPALNACSDNLEERMMERLSPDRRRRLIDLLVEFASLNNDLSRAPHKTPPAVRQNTHALDDVQG
ncbi:MAG: MarR family winged helix-turn-helix transcriptional regulator [Pseudomonadota bacterium]